jgi:hypothetical protein
MPPAEMLGALVVAPPACVTVNVWLATVMVPVREPIEVFASPVKLTDPLVVPEVVDPK